MPRTAALDTPVRDEMKTLNAITGRLDGLNAVDPKSLSRVLDWMDTLPEGLNNEEGAKMLVTEVKAMAAIVEAFGKYDHKTRDRMVRYFNELYAPEASAAEAEDGPRPL